MTETKWTKGPWELRENIPYDTGGWVVFHGRFKENETVCRLPYGNILPCPDTEERRKNTANAHLIAAAPELYEGLEAVRLAIKDSIETGLSMNNSKYDSVGIQAVNALKKARGEQ